MSGFDRKHMDALGFTDASQVTQGSVKEAYHKLAKVCHPDVVQRKLTKRRTPAEIVERLKLDQAKFQAISNAKNYFEEKKYQVSMPEKQVASSREPERQPQHKYAQYDGDRFPESVHEWNERETEKSNTKFMRVVNGVLSQATDAKNTAPEAREWALFKLLKRFTPIQREQMLSQQDRRGQTAYMRICAHGEKFRKIAERGLSQEVINSLGLKNSAGINVADMTKHAKKCDFKQLVSGMDSLTADEKVAIFQENTAYNTVLGTVLGGGKVSLEKCLKGLSADQKMKVLNKRHHTKEYNSGNTAFRGVKSPADLKACFKDLTTNQKVTLLVTRPNGERMNRAFVWLASAKNPDVLKACFKGLSPKLCAGLLVSTKYDDERGVKDEKKLIASMFGGGEPNGDISTCLEVIKEHLLPEDQKIVLGSSEGATLDSVYKHIQRENSINRLNCSIGDVKSCKSNAKVSSSVRQDLLYNLLILPEDVQLPDKTKDFLVNNKGLLRSAFSEASDQVKDLVKERLNQKDSPFSQVIDKHRHKRSEGKKPTGSNKFFSKAVGVKATFAAKGQSAGSRPAILGQAGGNAQNVKPSQKNTDNKHEQNSDDRLNMQ